MTQFTGKVAGGHILYVPPAHAIHNTGPYGRCLVVVNADGDQCGHPCMSQRELVSHTSECARRHASAINAYRKRTHPDIMRAWDPELEEWFAKHKDAVLEGRKKA
jgi:hypothetical protein